MENTKDYIEIKAPPGYQLSYLQPGFQHLGFTKLGGEFLEDDPRMYRKLRSPSPFIVAIYLGHLKGVQNNPRNLGENN